MKPYPATLLNAITLILMSAWAYFSMENGSTTALIPMVFGLIFLLLAPGVKKENKLISHIAVALTILVILSLYMPFKGALDRGDNLAVFRVLLMIATGVIATMAYIKSFRQARAKKS